MGPNGAAIAGVYSDEMVLPLRVKANRFYRGFDLAQFDWRINYMNPQNDRDVFRAQAIEVSEDAVEFVWLLSRFATAGAGILEFSICAIRAEDGEIVQEINSAPAQLEVLDGLEVEQDADMAARLDWLGAAVDDLLEPIEKSEAARVSAETARAAAEAERVAAEAARIAAEAARAAAEAERAAAEAQRLLDEAKRKADFADMAASLTESRTLILAADQYDAGGRPNFDGQGGIIYYVPVTGSDDDHYNEWAWVGGAWERLGTTQANLAAVSTDAIDAIVVGEDAEDGNEVVTQTGLKYFWAKLKAWALPRFAALVHGHSAMDVTMETIIEDVVDTVNGTTTTNTIYQGGKTVQDEIMDLWDSQSQSGHVASGSLDSLVQRGSYRVTSIPEIPSASKYGILHVLPVDDQFLTQVFVQDYAGDIYVRNRFGTQWSNWVKH